MPLLRRQRLQHWFLRNQYHIQRPRKNHSTYIKLRHENWPHSRECFRQRRTVTIINWIRKTGLSIPVHFRVLIPSFNNGVHIERIPHTDYVVLYGQLFGLDIVWDGDSSFFIHVANSDKWAGNLCGLCGNYNGDMLDDMTPKGLGKIDYLTSTKKIAQAFLWNLADVPTSDVATVMDSWQVREDSTTSCSTPDVTHYCSGLSTEQIEVRMHRELLWRSWV